MTSRCISDYPDCAQKSKLPSCEEAITLSLLFLILLCSPAGGQNTRPKPDERYTVAFASVVPLNTDIFIAAADGSDARPFLAHPDLDYNASFSPDGRSIVFTSTRNGSADIYRAGIDGASPQRLTDDPAFDDQGVLSPDGRSLASSEPKWSSGHLDSRTGDWRAPEI